MSDRKRASEEESESPKKIAKSDSTEAVFELGSRRKVSVSKFKGSVLVNIREFYIDKSSGEEKPGNKGIALSIDQYNKLKEYMDDIDKAIAAQK